MCGNSGHVRTEMTTTSKPAEGPKLLDGARVGVIGGGPAGSLFSYFLLSMAHRARLDLQVDLYEPRDFSICGPAGCNMCGGIISESLVQALATEGIQLPPTVVKRGIDAYVLHTAQGDFELSAPSGERRIAAVHRGGGPRGATSSSWASFDRFLLGLARERGARWVPERVASIQWQQRYPQLVTVAGRSQVYDLVAVAAGVKTSSPELFADLGIGYTPPRTARAFNCELHLGEKRVSQFLGNSMHLFLLGQPGLKFAALIPKGEFVTVCLLGEIDRAVVQRFLSSPPVQRCLPSGIELIPFACQCRPRLNTGAGGPWFADRLVFIGDSGVTRLYKDGIGAAYRTAKAAAVTAVFEGVSAADFRRQYQPVCRAIRADNRIGQLIFAASDWQQRRATLQIGLLRALASEQRLPPAQRTISMVLWDTFTGSAPYSDVLVRALWPSTLGRLVRETLSGFGQRRAVPDSMAAPRHAMANEPALGRVFHHGEEIVRQGECGDCMYVVQAGQVEVIATGNGGEVRLAILGSGEIFGEMALCTREVRSATVRALGDARVLSVDAATFLRRVHEDPSFSMRVIEQLSCRLRALNDELTAGGAGK